MEPGEHAEPPSAEFPASPFDEFADGYDRILELPWYAWLFARLHTLIIHNIIRPFSPQTVLDAGCGTGFQSFLYAAFGARVVGIDVSPRMIHIAREKAARFPAERNALLTIPASFSFAHSYNRWIQEHLDNTLPRTCVRPVFEVADAQRLPFRDGTFDHVNCCGSTISLVPDYFRALKEMVRVLKPGGTLFLEAEGRWNGDLFWSLLDALRGGHWYGMSWKQARAMVSPPFLAPVNVDYPLEHLRLRLTLFTRKGLTQDLQRLGMRVLRNQTIHSLTNIVPSPILHRRDVPKGIQWLFRVLTLAERRLPYALPGCSLIFVARKESLNRPSP